MCASARGLPPSAQARSKGLLPAGAILAAASSILDAHLFFFLSCICMLTHQNVSVEFDTGSVGPQIIKYSTSAFPLVLLRPIEGVFAYQLAGW